MSAANKNITIEKVQGKPYCRVEDDHHIYFIPNYLRYEVEDYMRRSSFENHQISSLQGWYLSLPMNVRTSIIVVLDQKIA